MTDKKKYWEKLANSHGDELKYVLGNSLFETLAQNIDQEASIGKAIHFGSGAGQLTLLWGKKAVDISGIDSDSNSIWLAQQANSEVMQNIHFLTEGEFAIDLTSETQYDTIIVDALMNSLNKPSEWVERYHSILKPGGRFIFLAYCPTASKFLSGVFTAFRLMKTYGLTHPNLSELSPTKMNHTLLKHGFKIRKAKYLGQKTRLIWMEAEKRRKTSKT